MEQKIGNIYRSGLAMLFMALLQFFVYFGFANQYSSTSFNFTAFNEQYNSGVYQFRFLSTKAIEELYHFLSASGWDFSGIHVHFLDPSADLPLYLAFFIYNSFFAVLCIGGISRFLNKTQISLSTSEKLLTLLLCASLIAFSQFVIVPYDTFSYFMLVLFANVFIHYLERKKTRSNFFFLCLFIVIGTLNRETMALSLAFAGALLLNERGIGKDSIGVIAIFTLIFIATYLGLRFFFNAGTTNDGLLLIENFSNPKNLLAFVFELILFLLPYHLSHGYEQKKVLSFFYILCLPYLIFCLWVGILFEIRLFIPVFILGLLLSKSSIQNMH